MSSNKDAGLKYTEGQKEIIRKIQAQVTDGGDWTIHELMHDKAVLAAKVVKLETEIAALKEARDQ